jgi:predicted RND superfamily exporter protein
MQIDASADTLLLEDDKDLLFANEVSKRYMTDSFLVVTFRSKDPLLSDKSLKTIQNLSDELSALPLVKKITSILNVPLLQSPPLPLSELLKKIPTLNSPNTSKTLAILESFISEPLTI